MPQKLADCRSGTTAIEYALIASLIATVLVASLIAIGGTLEGFFQSVDSGFSEEVE